MYSLNYDVKGDIILINLGNRYQIHCVATMGIFYMGEYKNGNQYAITSDQISFVEYDGQVDFSEFQINALDYTLRGTHEDGCDGLLLLDNDNYKYVYTVENNMKYHNHQLKLRGGVLALSYGTQVSGGAYSEPYNIILEIMPI